MKIVDAEGRELPWDGKAFGDFLVRGHWVCREYLNRGADGAANADGLLRTGDVCTIDPDGTVTLPREERDISRPLGMSGRCDRGPPRGHRRSAKRAVRLG